MGGGKLAIVMVLMTFMHIF